MVRRRHSRELDLTPPRLDLCLYLGMHDRLAVYRRDQSTGAVATLTGWSNVTAMIRDSRGGDTTLDLLPAIVGDEVEILITPAMKDDFALPAGVWEVDITNPDGDVVTLIHGDVRIFDEVVTV